MISATIIIENVDLDLLESQRLALRRVIDAAIMGRQASREDIREAEGLENMLDVWSDNRYHTGEVEGKK